jgi:hypothetical protein
MYDENVPDSLGRGGILGNLGGDAYVPTPSAPAPFRLAIGRDTPVQNYATFPNPFNFTDFGSMENRHIWNKLMFDPKMLPTNFFYWFLNDYQSPRRIFLGPAPMGPGENAPILPPQFR